VISELVYYMVSDVARATGLSGSGVRYRIRQGVLPVAARTLSGIQLIAESDVEAQEPSRQLVTRADSRTRRG
jgi:hypothetical protein